MCSAGRDRTPPPPSWPDRKARVRMCVPTALARAVLALLALALLTMPGCGGGSSSTPSSPTSPSSPTQPPVTGNACAAIAGLLSTSQTIVNGTDCTALTYASSVVRLRMQNAAGDIFTCSSTVIDDLWVLTAAHCLPADTTLVQVDLGPGPLVTATEFHANPRYTGPGDGSPDVGVVKFSQSLGHKAVPLLLSRDAAPLETAVIAGYGEGGAGVSAGVLRAAFVSVSSSNDAYVLVNVAAGGSSICSGDSGGPLLISQGGEYTVAGITSASTAGCVSGTSFFVRVRNSGVSSFILNYVPLAGQR